LICNIYQLPQSAVRKILSAPPPAESNSFRVDFRSSHVHYLNNLEEDAMYRRWRSNLQEVLLTTHFLHFFQRLTFNYCLLCQAKQKSCTPCFHSIRCIWEFSVASSVPFSLSLLFYGRGGMRYLNC
jgi:hypothetical protein